MKLEIELFRDNEMGQWGYTIPVLSIVGTGCRDREAAEDGALDAVRFALGSQRCPSPDDSVMVEYEVRLTKSPLAV